MYCYSLIELWKLIWDAEVEDYRHVICFLCKLHNTKKILLKSEFSSDDTENAVTLHLRLTIWFKFQYYGNTMCLQYSKAI